MGLAGLIDGLSGPLVGIQNDSEKSTINCDLWSEAVGLPASVIVFCSSDFVSTMSVKLPASLCVYCLPDSPSRTVRRALTHLGTNYTKFGAMSEGVAPSIQWSS
jgi:hypothetical protein